MKPAPASKTAASIRCARSSPPELLWLRSDELFGELEKWPRVQLKTERLADKAANTNLGYQTLPDLAVQAQNKSAAG